MLCVCDPKGVGITKLMCCVCVTPKELEFSQIFCYRPQRSWNKAYVVCVCGPEGLGIKQQYYYKVDLRREEENERGEEKRENITSSLERRIKREKERDEGDRGDRGSLTRPDGTRQKPT